ncbi:MAG TPA: exodeoxyribonuclease V subunit gamma [Acidimicrobiales bacterium]|nr:exodeoxyribonuclease V subunit gamma [Acidimicrobiales bacterium]
MLHIHRAERADGLVEGLAGLLSEPLADPMETEVVAVPTRGVERWLTQRLSARLGVTPGRSDGVCANLELPFPGRLVGGAVAAATGVDPEADPWLPERSVWPLLEVVDEALPEPWLAPLAAHLGGAGPDNGAGDSRRIRRFSAVRHIADLFDRYSVHRPEMLRWWAVGDDLDGAGRPLPDDTAWQAQLWRCLRSRIGSDSAAERLEAACARLRAEPSLCDLPDRLSLFGLTRLATSSLQVLRALAEERDVHLFLLHPSPVLWERIAEQARVEAPVVRRRDDHTTALPAHPLLASWGRDAREMQLVLTGGHPVDPVDHHHGLEIPVGTLLQRVQADIRADRAPPGAPLPGEEDARAPLLPDDRSIQVHACHGRARQVEVVRDAILHLLAEDETLEARDVIVMCPDIETFAPLVHATFGTGTGAGGATIEEEGEAGGHHGADLRVRLADRSLRQTNPVLATVSELLALADARVTASQVLDLAGRDPVRRRFGFDDEDLARIEEWVVASGVRWGLDAAHRAPFKLEGVAANTWRAGLDRVLVGAAMAEDGQRLFGHVLPLDDVDSGVIGLAGRLAELLDRLQACLAGLGGPQLLHDWTEAITAAVDELTDTSEDDSWQRVQLRRLLDEVVGEATAEGATSTAELTLPEVRALLADRLRGRPTRANFRTGHLTVCTLVPMRSVPHRVVCLLGLDDGMFPRRTTRDGDDLILDDPYVGDRDARSEDRQLLLDALLAATDHLVITYTGRDERTNAERPPAVPVGELLDLVDATAAPAARRQVVTHHPLQPFDARNFAVGRLVPDRSWSFDTVSLAGARALQNDRVEPAAFVAGPLPVPPVPVVELEQLVRFLQHPVKAFLRQRLGVAMGDRSQDLHDELPVELDALERWGVGERLLQARLTGAGPEQCVAAEVARGALPPGALAATVLDALGPAVEMLVAAASTGPGSPATEPTSVEIHLPLPDGRLLSGTVAGVTGNVLRAVTFSRVGPKHRLAAWAQYLALTAAVPGAAREALTLGRRRVGASWRCSITRSAVAAFEGTPAARRQRALEHLVALVDLYDRGMREPLPIYCATSAAYAAAARAAASGGSGDTGSGARAAAAEAWTSAKFDKEDKDPAHVLVLGGVRTLDDVLEAPPRPDEQDELWPAGETSRFGGYAVKLWQGLLSCEAVVDE